MARPRESSGGLGGNKAVALNVARKVGLKGVLVSTQDKLKCAAQTRRSRKASLGLVLLGVRA